MKTVRLFTLIFLSTLSLLFSTSAMAQCGPIQANVVLSQNPFVIWGTDYISVTALTTVTLAPGATIPPVAVNYTRKIYGDGLLISTAAGTISWNSSTNSATQNGGSLILPRCGNFTVEVTAIGLNANGNACSQQVTAEDELCITQYVINGRTASCDTDICNGNPGTARLAEGSILSLESVHQSGSGNLIVEVDAPTSQPASLELMTLTGQVILSQSLNLSQGIHTYKLPLQGISAGMYLFRVQTAQELQSQKVILK